MYQYQYLHLCQAHTNRKHLLSEDILQKAVLFGKKVNKDTFEYITVLAVNPVWLIDPAISWHPVAVVIIRSSRS